MFYITIILLTLCCASLSKLTIDLGPVRVVQDSKVLDDFKRFRYDWVLGNVPHIPDVLDDIDVSIQCDTCSMLPIKAQFLREIVDPDQHTKPPLTEADVPGKSEQHFSSILSSYLWPSVSISETVQVDKEIHQDYKSDFLAEVVTSSANIEIFGRNVIHLRYICVGNGMTLVKYSMNLSGTSQPLVWYLAKKCTVGRIPDPKNIWPTRYKDILTISRISALCRDSLTFQYFPPSQCSQTFSITSTSECSSGRIEVQICENYQIRTDSTRFPTYKIDINAWQPSDLRYPNRVYNTIDDLTGKLDSVSSPSLLLQRAKAFLSLNYTTLAKNDLESIVVEFSDYNNMADVYHMLGKAYLYDMEFVEASSALKKGSLLDINHAVRKAHSNLLNVITRIDENSGKNDEENSKQKDSQTMELFGAMKTWLEGGGAKFSKLAASFTQTPGLQNVKSERGMLALADLRNGEKIVYIPSKFLMTLELAKQSEIGTLIQKENLKLHNELAFIAAYILEEQQKGEDSFWKPYMDLLPTSLSHHTLFYSDEELQVLQNTQIPEIVRVQREVLRNEYVNLCEKIVSFSKHSLDSFILAHLIVQSRQFDIVQNQTSTHAMVPIADLLNHSPDAETPYPTIWHYSDISDGFLVIANQNIPAMSQVFDNYGQKCNSKYLTNYGFVLKKNVKNTVALQVDTSLFPHVQSDEVAMIISKDLADQVTRDSLHSLRVIHARTEQQFRILTHKNWDTDSPFNIENELLVLNYLSQSALAQLNRFSTTVEHDREMLLDQNMCLTQNMHNSLVVRIGEKDVLHHYVSLAAIAIPLLSTPTFGTLNYVHHILNRMNVPKSMKAYRITSTLMSYDDYQQYLENVIMPLLTNYLSKAT